MASEERADNDALDGDILSSSIDGLSVALALVLGLLALSIAIVGVVIDSSALTIITGVAALVLAGTTAWLIYVRRALTDRLRTREAEVIRLESSLGEQVKARIAAESARPEAPASPGSQTQMAGLVLSGEENDLTDPTTGLLGERYFALNLDGRVAAARRHLRPLSLILLDVIRGLENGSPDNAEPTVVSEIITSTLRDADTVCRLADGRFALILEDTPENGAIWTVERIRRRVNEALDDTTVWAGVACYPAHGFDGPEVLAQARKAVTSARDWHQDRTEVAEG